MAAARAQTEPGRAHRAGADGPRERERRQAFLPALVTLGVPRQAALSGEAPGTTRRRVRRRRGRHVPAGRPNGVGHSARGSARAREAARTEARRERASRRECHRKHPDQRAPGLSFRVRRSRFGARARTGTRPRPPRKTFAISVSSGSSGRSVAPKAFGRSGASGEVSFPNSRRISSWRFSRLAVAADSALDRGSVDVCSVSPRSPSLSSFRSTPAKRKDAEWFRTVVADVLVRPDRSVRAPREPASRFARRAVARPSRAPRRALAKLHHLELLELLLERHGGRAGAPPRALARRAHGFARPVRVVPLGRARRRPALAGGARQRTLLAHTALALAPHARLAEGHARARVAPPRGSPSIRRPRDVSASCDRGALPSLLRPAAVAASAIVAFVGNAAPSASAKRTGPSPAPGAPLPRGAWRGGDGDRSRDSASLPSKSVLSTTLCVSLLPGRTEIFAALRPASAVFASARCLDVCRARRAWGGGVTDRRVARVRRGTARRNAKTRSRGRGGGLLLCENSKNPYHASGASRRARPEDVGWG